MALLRSFPDRSGPEYDDKRKENVNGTCRVTNIRCALPVISSGDRGRQQRSAVKSDRVPLVDVGNRDYAVYPNARYDEEKFRARKKWNIEDKINVNLMIFSYTYLTLFSYFLFRRASPEASLLIGTIFTFNGGSIQSRVPIFFCSVVFKFVRVIFIGV